MTVLMEPVQNCSDSQILVPNSPSIVMTPVQPCIPAGPSLVENLSLVSPLDDLHRGCPVLTKTRAVLVNKGVQATLQWGLRDRQGQAVNIDGLILDSGESSDVTQSGQIIVRFTEVLGNGSTIYQLLGTAVSAAAGVVQVTLSNDLVNQAGIYAMELGITDGARLIFSDKGWLSVERGLFGDTSSLLGPPTLGELRIQLRDTMIENELTDEVEFDDAEIIYCLRRPIQKWNETPPPVAQFDTSNFPFYDYWLKATIASLLRLAAGWYERNRLNATHGGITVDDKNKSQFYMSLAKDMEAECLDFIYHKKVEINAWGAIGGVVSSYGHRWG